MNPLCSVGEHSRYLWKSDETIRQMPRCVGARLTASFQRHLQYRYGALVQSWFGVVIPIIAERAGERYGCPRSWQILPPWRRVKCCCPNARKISHASLYCLLGIRTMSLTKFALGMMGRLRPKPARLSAASSVQLPEPEQVGGMALMEALSKRRSVREFSPMEVPLPVMSNLLWAAFGINRADGHRTAPTAINSQEIDIYVALASGAYLYDASSHALELVAGSDLRRVTGYQDFVDEAPMDLIFVADHARMPMVPADRRECYASVAAGAIAQNVYLYAASAGLATVIRAWIDRDAISEALGLTHDQQVLLSQTVGYPRVKDMPRA